MLATDLPSVAYTSTTYGRTEPSRSPVWSHTIQSPLAVLCEHVNVPRVKKK